MESEQIHIILCNFEVPYEILLQETPFNNENILTLDINMSTLEKETLTMTILEFECTCTIVRVLWLEIFLHTLNDKDLVKIYKSEVSALVTASQ